MREGCWWALWAIVSFLSFQHFMACTTSFVDPPCHWDSLEDPPKLCLDFWCPGMALGALLVAQTVKNLLAMQETQV